MRPHKPYRKWTEERRNNQEEWLATIRGVKRGRRCQPAERFWPKVDKCGPILRAELGRCWVWTGARDGHGYGCFNIDRKNNKAHRFSWELKHGRKPTQDILHKCDNPSCVRPTHLFEGTPTDNALDMIAKGRHRPARGEKHPRAKLTAIQIKKIRSEADSGIKLEALAAEYGVSRGNIWSIAARTIWRHI